MSSDARPRNDAATVDEVDWEPTGPGRACRNCGTHVSRDLVRVFGDGEGLAHCPSCPGISVRDLGNGAGIDQDYDPATDRRPGTTRSVVVASRGED